MTNPPPHGASRPVGDPVSPREDESIGQLLSDVSRDLSTLMRQEIDLAKAEAKQSATNAGKGAGMFGGAGVAALLMLVFLSLALMWLLGEGLGLGLGWGALIVGVIWAIVAAILALVGKKSFQDVGMQQTTDSAKRIPDALKGNEHTDRKDMR